MAVFFVHYTVGDKPAVLKIEADSFEWQSAVGMARFLKTQTVVGQCANVSAVVDSASIRG